MSLHIRDKLDAGPLFDNAIVAHHFTPYMRDYDVLVDTAAPLPDGKGSYHEGRYRYRFTHCVVAHVTTTVNDYLWKSSWEDYFTDYSSWEAAGTPEGYVWGVCESIAYPGLRYVEDSLEAQEWRERLVRLMHEVVIETNAFALRLIFHDVDICKIAKGNPLTGELLPL